MIKGPFYEITPSAGYFFDLMVQPKDKKTPVKFYGISLRSCLTILAREMAKPEEEIPLNAYLENIKNSYEEIEKQWDTLIEEKYRDVIRKKW